jgi:hypothetical protein
MNKEQLLDNMKGALGGRAAEQVSLFYYKWCLDFQEDYMLYLVICAFNPGDIVSGHSASLLLFCFFGV